MDYKKFSKETFDLTMSALSGRASINVELNDGVINRSFSQGIKRKYRTIRKRDWRQWKRFLKVFIIIFAL